MCGLYISGRETMFSKKDRIFKLIKNGTAEELSVHLEKYPDAVNRRSGFNRGYSQPLTWATYFNKPEALKILIAHGANIDAKNTDGYSGLYYCARDQYQECTEILIQAKATIDTKTLAACHASLRPLLVDAIAKEALPKNTGTFVKEGDYLVSITEIAPSCNLAETTLYNFNKQTVSVKRNDCTHPLVTSFQQAASKKELREAAEFLQENHGDLYGFKCALIR
jgi:hypothetical protein|tara:strand:+ start:309762 stop:310430 length:669 start_codon:yes stop_codon:yes gene_type:complete